MDDIRNSVGNMLNIGNLFGTNNTKTNTKTNNRPAAAAANSSGSGSGFGKIVGIIMFVVFFILIFIVYKKSSTVSETENKYEPILISAPVNAYDPSVSKTGAEIPNPVAGLEYSYSFWIYISDFTYKYGQWKRVLSKGDASTSTGVSPEISIYPNTNALQVRLSTTTGLEGADVQNIPLKKWNHIVMSLNNRAVDIYINGYLERSVVLKGVPILNDSPLYVCKPNESGQAPGYYGQISRLQYFARSLLTTEISTLYQAGPYGSASKSYEVTFMDNGNLINYTESNANNIPQYNVNTST